MSSGTNAAGQTVMPYNAGGGQTRDIEPAAITAAIFCNLPEEANAVKCSLDEQFTCRLRLVGQHISLYTYGRIAGHNVVIARPSNMGPVPAAVCAARVSQHFPNVRFAVVVGVGAAIPNPPRRDIRLGDIAVSKVQHFHSGVLQYDSGIYEQDGFTQLGAHEKLPLFITSAEHELEEDGGSKPPELGPLLNSIIEKSGFRKPDTPDVLYHEDFHHLHRGADCSGCEAHPGKMTVPRPPRPDQLPLVHRGLILSGNATVKNPGDRDRLRRGHEDAICFETTAAGVMDVIPCIVIRGICDYADTHGQDDWREYASAIAAAYCKAFLDRIVVE